MKKSSLLLVLPLVAVVISAGNEGRPSDTRAQKVDADESGRIVERIKLYLSRHGDRGRIDPNRRLRMVREEYERRLRLRAREAGQAVQGSGWTSIGPTNGAGRATAIAVDSSTPGRILIGAADGGVWETDNDGVSWRPLTDSINDLSVGALAIAPSSPNVIYLGTGEGGYAADFVPGIGLLKSNDNGATWIFPGSVVATKFYRILVDPANANIVVAGTDQGAIRSTDGGATWQTVIDPALYHDVADIVRSPANPNIMYAATWDALNWCAGSGQCAFASPRVLMSSDGGQTWSEKSNGLPVSTSSIRVDRMSLAISASNPRVLYAACAIGTGSFSSEVSHIFKSTDGANSWNDLASVSGNGSVNSYLAAQDWYDNTIVVSPRDENDVIAGGQVYIRTTDGGATWQVAPFLTPPSSVHVDAHDLRYEGSRLLVACDGGIWASPDDGVTAASLNQGLVTRQFYALAIDPAEPSRIIAGSQDNGTDQRPDSGGTDWSGISGGDGIQCAINPLDTSIAYVTAEAGQIFRTKSAGSGSPLDQITPPYSYGENASFFTVVRLDPTNPGVIYTGSYRVWRSGDGGDDWRPLSTTTTDGSIWSQNSIRAIAVSKSDPKVLMAANGGVFRTTDGGVTWVDASAGLPARTLNALEIDPTSPAIAFAAFAGTGGANLYRTADGGRTWVDSSAGLPLFSAQVIRFDPTDPSVLYCGTDVGVYRSTDQGIHWVQFGSGLPDSSVHDLQIQDDGSSLRVATHGRGIWELQVPPSGHSLPSAAITAPSASLNITKGDTVQFSGSISSSVAGATVNGVWFFPDRWEDIQVGAGQQSLNHQFNVGGVFPVSLTAIDGSGASSSATVTVIVSEPASLCASPIVVPGGGPFPVQMKLNNETAAWQFGNPDPVCANGQFQPVNSIWLEFTPATTGSYEFTTCGSSLDLVVSAWLGPRCGPYSEVSALSCSRLGSAGSSCYNSLNADLVLHLSAAVPVRVLVSSYSDLFDTGGFTLTVDSLLPVVTGAAIEGRNLVVTGRHFDRGVIVVDGVDERTTPSGTSPGSTLFWRKGARRITPGATVVIQVRNADGTLSNSFSFTR